jgi:hypothetical protein
MFSPFIHRVKTPAYLASLICQEKEGWLPVVRTGRIPGLPFICFRISIVRLGRVIICKRIEEKCVLQKRLYGGCW